MKKLRTAFSALKKRIVAWLSPMRSAPASPPGGPAFPVWWPDFLEGLEPPTSLPQGEAKSWKNYGLPMGALVPIGKPKGIVPPPPSGALTSMGGNQSAAASNVEKNNAIPPECAKEPEPEEAEERLVFEDSPRFNEIMNSDMGKGWALYDPQCDEPLDPVSESNMNQMGPAAFLQMLCVQYGVTISPLPRSEWECERAARKTVRTKIDTWKGERFVQ